MKSLRATPLRSDEGGGSVVARSSGSCCCCFWRADDVGGGEDTDDEGSNLFLKLLFPLKEFCFRCWCFGWAASLPRLRDRDTACGVDGANASKYSFRISFVSATLNSGAASEMDEALFARLWWGDADGDNDDVLCRFMARYFFFFVAVVVVWTRRRNLFWIVLLLLCAVREKNKKNTEFDCMKKRVERKKNEWRNLLHGQFSSSEKCFFFHVFVFLGFTFFFFW